MATIRITPKFPLVMFAVRLSSFRVIVDGGEELELPVGGSSELEVTPGSHHLRMFFPWVLPREMGPAEIDVSVEEGETVELRYKPPWIRTQPGRVRVVS